MSQHDFDVANGSGAAVRADLNLALKALASHSAGAVDPITSEGVTYAYMFWVDSSGGSPILKMRNGANNAWITVGTCSLTNFGFLTLADGGTLAAALLFSNTDYMKMPVGTTGQRPGSPAAGMIRYNSTLGQFEGYTAAGAWVPFGLGVLAGGTTTPAGGSYPLTLTSAYDGKIVFIDSSAARTLTLPTPVDGFKVTFMDKAGTMGTFNATIARASSELIMGIAASYTLSANWGSWTFVSDGTNWFII